MQVQAAGTEMTIGTEPEFRFTPNGSAVWKCRAVASGRKKNDDGTWEDVNPTWYELTAWNQLAENCAETLEKLHKVIVNGDVYNEEWEDKEGGKRYTLKVKVKSIGPSLAFATAKVSKVERSGSSSGGGGQAQRSSAPAEDTWTQPESVGSDEPPF